MAAPHVDAGLLEEACVICQAKVRCYTVGVMSALPEILQHNAAFVANKEYEAFLTSPLPNKRLVIVTCMDTRLVELLPKAMGIRNGDVKMIKTAGAMVTHPFGSVMRSVLVAVYQLEADEIAVVGHHGCGMTGLKPGTVLDKALHRGISPKVLDTLGHAGIDMQKWLTGVESPQAGVQASVEMIRNHPLLPAEVPVHGLMIHPETGRLEVLQTGK
jgi:carbonic anhydrase